jgi:hypothetical protein
MSERPPIPDDPIAAALRKAFADERAPDGLEKRLARSLRVLPTRTHGAPSWPWPAIATAAVALMIGLGIIFWRSHTAELADVPLKELQAFIDSGRAVDVATDDPVRVRAWVAERVDFAPPRVARGAAEIELIGGRLCLFSGRRVASYMYRVHGRLLSIYIMTSDGLKPTGSRLEHAGRTLTLTREGNLSQASWTENGLIYSAVGEELSELALLSTLDELSR